MHFRSMLLVKALSGRRDDAVEEFKRLHVLADTAKTVAGYIDGELLIDTHDSSMVCITARWTSQSAYQEWVDSPVRLAQMSAFPQGLMDDTCPPTTFWFQCAQVVHQDTAGR